MGGALLAALLSLIWSLIAGWIARAEFLQQRALHEAGSAGDTCATSPNQFLYRQAKPLCRLLPIILVMAGFTLLPGLAAGLINRFPVLGSLLVSVLLPVPLIASLATVIILAGAFSYWIMPAALAAEGSEFEALSRGYSYLLQRPYRFAWWWSIALALSGLPVAGILWLERAQPNVGGTALSWFAGAAAMAVSLSLFWTLQSVFYLKMRRLVDGIPETELWIGPGEDTAAAQPRMPDLPVSGAKGEPVGPGTTPAIIAAPPPTRTDFTFADSLWSRDALGWRRLGVLFLGTLWSALVLAGGALVAWKLTAAAGQGFGLESVHAALLQLAEQRPILLAAIAAATVLLAAPAVGGAARRVSRLAVLSAAFDGKVRFRDVPLRALRPFIKATRYRGLGSVLWFTAGVELFLMVGCLVPLASRGTCSWVEVAALAGSMVVCLGLGALGLGAVAVQGSDGDGTRAGAATAYLGNFLETIGSAAANLVFGLLRFGLVLGMVTAAWWLMCATISWSGGAQVQWLRWGLGGRLFPTAEDGVYRIASAIAGVWFVLFFGLALVYPLSDVLRWGVGCFLRAREKAEGIPVGQLKLRPEEWDALVAQRTKQRKQEEVPAQAAVEG